MHVIHHLNCGTMCPRGRRLLNGDGGWLEPGRLVCHVLLIETPDGLVLVDTGFGRGDVERPAQLARPFLALTRPRLQLAETAVSQVRAAGFDPADVRHIVLTHLDVDHAGGLPDFVDAQVHVVAREHETMLSPPRRERRRYRTGASHWAHGPRWVKHAPDGDQWLGFESLRVLPGSGPEILLIPLAGHTLGHTGVAVADGDRWLLHCGDAYFHHDEVQTPPSCPPGLRAFQNLVQADRGLRRQNQERLRELARRQSGDVQLICSHDAGELERAQVAAHNGSGAEAYAPSAMSVTGSILRLHQALYERTDGRVGHTLLGVPALLLQTTGRRTGATRINALIYAQDGDEYLVVPSNGGADRPPGWLCNLVANPRVAIQVGRQHRPATATIIEPADESYQRLWQLVNDNNRDRYTAYQAQTSRPIPIVALTPR